MTEPETPGTDDAADLRALLGDDARRPRRRLRMWLAGLALVAAAAAAAAWLLTRESKPAGPRYATEPVTVGTLVVRVSATGNLEPTNQVQIGSELSGIVTQVLVDDNAHVTAGQVLLVLDTSRLESAVANSRANLEAARAQVRQAEATVGEARATLARLDELARISEGRLPAGTELDAARATVARAEATLGAARAAVSQARANLSSDETNLAKATIRSPIDGVVLSRAVEPGQTVAATLQAPVLFTIAEDLATMELRVDVDEADVGRVAVGQQATFSVDAWPGRTYEGTIVRVGLGARVTNDVVTYPAVLAVANDDLTLRPGMTATAEIVTLTRDGALQVPNAALRFDPAQLRARTRTVERNFIDSLVPRPPRHTPPLQTAAVDGGTQVWVLTDEGPAPVDIVTGETDGRQTEVLGGSLEPGMRVITERARGTP